MKRPALLVRFPSIWKKPVSHPVLPPGATADYPTLAEDIARLGEIVGEPFAESDRAALEHQNRFRRQQVIILLGTAVLSGLGGLQAVFPAQRWPGLLLVALGLVLTAVAMTARQLGTLELFLTERVKAERLRSAYFRYLSRTGRYVGSDRQLALRRAVVLIKKGEEPL
jgi:uncharacterized protein DUF4231